VHPSSAIDLMCSLRKIGEPGKPLSARLSSDTLAIHTQLEAHKKRSAEELKKHSRDVAHLRGKLGVARAAVAGHEARHEVARVLALEKLSERAMANKDALRNALMKTCMAEGLEVNSNSLPRT
jgi:hypothetical protein